MARKREIKKVESPVHVEGAEMRKGFQLKRPCRHCPFSPSKGTIVFACRERAEEIEQQAYRNGFPCHKSAVDTSDDDPEDGGYVFGENTQHCAGAIMMYLASGESSWPAIDNDDDLGEELSKHLDWKAPHFNDIEEFLKAKGGSK